MDLEAHSHGIGQCAYHIVLVPRYRHKIFLDAGLQKRCEDLLRELASREGCRLYELKVAPGYVHVFFGIKPTHPVSIAIRELKCNSAKVPFREHPEPKERFQKGTCGQKASSTDR